MTRSNHHISEGQREREKLIVCLSVYFNDQKGDSISVKGDCGLCRYPNPTAVQTRSYDKELK